MNYGDRVRFSADALSRMNADKNPHDERKTIVGSVQFVNHVTGKAHVAWSRYHVTIQDVNDLSILS